MITKAAIPATRTLLTTKDNSDAKSGDAFTTNQDQLINRDSGTKKLNAKISSKDDNTKVAFVPDSF